MKIKNTIIYVIVLIVVFLSFKVPEWVLKNEEDNMEMSYYWKQKESKIDVEAEKIYLVKAIHDIQEELSRVEIATDASKHGRIIEFSGAEMEELKVSRNFEKELLKLQEYNIIKYPSTVDTSGNNEYSAMSIIDRSYTIGEKLYTISNLEWIVDGNMYEFEVESKSGKILFISFDKNELGSTMDKETILRNYVNYLDLHIIDDWKYENGMLTSEKADLVVSIYYSEKSDTAMLSIHAISKYYEINNNIKNTTVVEASKN